MMTPSANTKAATQISRTPAKGLAIEILSTWLTER